MKQILATFLLLPLLTAGQSQFAGSFIGTPGVEEGYGIAMLHGKVYVTGTTSETNFPVTPGAVQDSLSGGYDLFISCFDTTGALIWSTYFGGNSYDLNPRIDAHPSGMLVVSGYTSSSDFPTTPGSWQPNLAGSYDTYVTTFDTNGALLWSTLFGGTGGDLGIDVTFDPAGNILVGGQSSSTDFPASAGAHQDTLAGAIDAYAAKFSPAGNLIWATLVGGAGAEDVHAIACDNTGNVVISGMTNSGNFFITPNAWQNSLGGYMDMYFTHFSPAGIPDWSTYFGGIDYDDILGLTCDSSGAVFAAGRSISPDFPVTPDALQPVKAGGYDAVIVKFSLNGSLEYSTFIGGITDDTGNRIATDSNDRIYFLMDTQSDSLPVIGPSLQPGNAGMHDNYLLKFSSSMDTLFSTYFGGSSAEVSTGLATWGTSVAFAGTSYSPALPFSNPFPYQLSPLGQGDVFWAMIRNSYDLIDTTDTTSVRMSGSDAGCLLYPNPSSGFVNVKSAFQPEEIIVTDIRGVTLLRITGVCNFGVSGLSPGQYLVTVRTSREVFHRRLVVQ